MGASHLPALIFVTPSTPVLPVSVDGFVEFLVRVCTLGIFVSAYLEESFDILLPQGADLTLCQHCKSLECSLVARQVSEHDDGMCLVGVFNFRLHDLDHS